jgi:PAS domain S-box-containing protein
LAERPKGKPDLLEDGRGWSDLFSVLPDIVLVVDSGGAILHGNRSFSGAPAAELAGRSVFEQVAKRAHRLREAIRAALDESVVSSVQVFREESGELKAYSVRVGPLVREGSPVAALLVATDITEDRKVAELVASDRQARIHGDKLRALGEMAADMAHEINTPLASICLLCEELGELASGRSPDLSLIARRSSDVRKAAEQISRIVRGLRTLSRNGVDDPLQGARIGELLHETVDLCGKKFELAGVELLIVEGFPEASVACRPSQVSQIVLNLLRNALDSVQRLEERWVRISGRILADGLEIRVTDSGPGIPEGIRERIFEEFFTTKPEGAGTGLGLSISKALAEANGGELSLDVASPRTCFVIRFPLMRESRAA